jgi:hypothetical protein
MPKRSYRYLDEAYLLQSGDTNHFKIGHGNTADRQQACQIGNPERLRFVLGVAGGYPMEQFLHGIFGSLRGISEWFVFPDRSIAGHLFFTYSERYWAIRIKYPDMKPKMLAALIARQIPPF